MSYFASLGRDIRSVFEHDPAAVIALEVLLAYPGFHARQFHAILHRLRLWKVPLLPRLISHGARFCTGIEVYPGAKIGPSWKNVSLAGRPPANAVGWSNAISPSHEG
jgi:serine O-acetyltransferase